MQFWCLSDLLIRSVDCCLLRCRLLNFYCCADKRVFGVPLSANIRQYGQALPPVIMNALKYLREGERLKLLGLFRRAASKARVDMLKEMADADPGLSPSNS